MIIENIENPKISINNLDTNHFIVLQLNKIAKRCKNKYFCSCRKSSIESISRMIYNCGVVDINTIIELQNMGFFLYSQKVNPLKPH